MRAIEKLLVIVGCHIPTGKFFVPNFNEPLGREPGLPPGCHENEDGFAVGLLVDLLEHGLVHGLHAGAVGLLLEAHGADGDLDRPCLHPEVEEPLLAAADPLPHVLRARQRRREAHEAHLRLHGVPDLAHAAHDHLEHRPALQAQHVHLVDDDQPHLLDLAAVVPVPADAVPLLRRRNQDICMLQRVDVRGEVTRQFQHFFVQHFAQSVGPVVHSFFAQGFQGRYLYYFLVGLFFEKPQHGQFCNLGFT